MEGSRAYSIMDDYKAYLNKSIDQSSYQSKSECELASDFKEEFLKLLTANVEKVRK